MIRILKPGLLTSVQDLGRYAYQKYGVIASGAMDPFAHRVANLLVGNDENTPTLEMTMMGPVIRFEEEALLAICGGDLSPEINGTPVGSWRTILVKKGSELKFGPCRTGTRAYLAVAGGFSVPTVMGSKSTYLRAQVGGFKGRALKEGDCLPFGAKSELSVKMETYFRAICENDFSDAGWFVASKIIPSYEKKSPVRIMKGRQFDLFTKDSQEKLLKEAFQVTTQSDRMGYRLEGPSLSLQRQKEMVSEAVLFGTIQVPSDGNAIILLADRQTTGGYPKIGQVATVDLPLVAQAKPGDKLTFSLISLDEAQQLILERERDIQQLKQGISLKLC